MKIIISFILMNLAISTAIANLVKSDVIRRNIKPEAVAVIQAENYNYTTGCHLYKDCDEMLVGDLGYGGIMGYYDVDFGQSGAINNIFIRYANLASGSQFYIQVKIDDKDNPENFVLLLPSKTDSWCDFRQISAQHEYVGNPITGLHRVYFVFYMDSINSDGPTFDSFALTITNP
ncbi:hypothetical protein CHUAL_008833 [Chamberlinius hualienensis]